MIEIYDKKLFSENHPQSNHLSRTSTSAERAPPRVIAPHQSNLTVFLSETDSSIYFNAINNQIIQTGKLIRKTYLHQNESISGPHMRGQKTEAAANDADHIQRA